MMHNSFFRNRTNLRKINDTFVNEQIFKTATMKSIIGIGNALTDVLAVMPDDTMLKRYKLPVGSMQWIDSATAATIWAEIKDRNIEVVPGGSAANTIAGCASLGMKSGFIGKVGDDEIGRLFRMGQEQVGISPMLLTGKDSSGRAIVFITPPNSERTFADYMGAALELCAQDLKEDTFKGYDMLHIEGYLVQNQDLVLRALEIGKKLGQTISLDLASYNVVESNFDFLHKVVKEYVDIVFANETEAKAFTHLPPEEALEALSAICKVGIVKIGPHGSYVGTAGKKYMIQPYPANKVDATGAGDLFASGFLYGYARNLPIEACGKIGSFVSSKVVEIVGTKMSGDSWNIIRNGVAEIVSSA